MDQNVRRVQVLQVDGQDCQRWVDCTLLDIKAGDQFMLFEPDGTPVTQAGSPTQSIFIADDFGFVDASGVHGIKIRTEEVKG
jgi:hypothetical protein